MSDVLVQRYDTSKSYDWNYEHAPDHAKFTQREPIAASKIPATFCDLEVDSPLGIAAGPLLNGKWLLHYAGLGFDILTYKTVRSSARSCYGLPNLQPILPADIAAGEDVEATGSDEQSWAISFGMPSRDPRIWRQDLSWTKSQLPAGKILSVSVVASAQPDWSMLQVAEDYALCAQWAAESGADVVELNLSCPNVSTVDGQLYQDLEATRLVTAEVRSAIPKKPIVLKIGYVESSESARRFVGTTADLVNAISMTNCLACRVRRSDSYLFNGELRGIGGAAIRSHSLMQIERFRKQIDALGCETRLVGVGGIFNASDVRDYLDAGAESVQLATAVMQNPVVGRRIKREWAG